MESALKKLGENIEGTGDLQKLVNYIKKSIHRSIDIIRALHYGYEDRIFVLYHAGHKIHVEAEEYTCICQIELKQSNINTDDSRADGSYTYKLALNGQVAGNYCYVQNKRVDCRLSVLFPY